MASKTLVPWLRPQTVVLHCFEKVSQTYVSKLVYMLILKDKKDVLFFATLSFNQAGSLLVTLQLQRLGFLSSTISQSLLKLKSI